MHYYKGCVVLFITLVNTFQIHGILEINFPASNVGNYGDSTHMNCTDSTFDVTNGYSWYKDAVIIYSSSTGDTGRYKSTHGSNYFTLEITDTDLTDNGVYQCSYNFQDISDTLEIQAKGKGAGKVENGKLEITFTGFYPVTTTVSSVTCNGKTITGSPTSTTTTGNFLTVIWTSSNNVDPSDLEAGCDATISSRTTYSIDVSVKEATTTTISTTSTTTSTSTTTPASTTTTPLKTTTTTTPASTTSTMPITTTSMRTPVTTSMPPTTSTTLASISTSSTKTSNEGLSDEIIIVIVIVPVGVIAIVGTIIFFCLFYRLRRGKRKPASGERHKQGRHYKENMRSVQQHQQQPYILYGRGHTRQLNREETKRSRSLHDDRYNWYDGYHWGSQVKRNPLYKGDRNLGRLYYNESLPRYDDYRSGYTTGHVYPSHTRGYHYRPNYHGDSRGHGNRQHSSYPVYSTQQEYFNPSYSYMGY